MQCARLFQCISNVSINNEKIILYYTLIKDLVKSVICVNEKNNLKWHSYIIYLVKPVLCFVEKKTYYDLRIKYLGHSVLCFY